MAKNDIRIFIASILILAFQFTIAQKPVLVLPVGHTAGIRCARFSPDGKKIVTASNDHSVKIWDANTGALLADLNGHISNVRTAQFSPDGKKIVTASDDQTAKIWDAISGKVLATLKWQNLSVIQAQFSEDGKMIITAYPSGRAMIWDAETGEFLYDLFGYSSVLNSTQYSANWKKIATTFGADNSAYLWDTTGKLLFELKGHTNTALTAEFSKDGNKVVTGSLDNTAKIWDVETGELLYNLTGHVSTVNSAEFSSDGKEIVTASSDNTAKIWNEKGILLIDLIGHSGPVNSAAFSPDGKKIVTASDDKTAKIWDTETGKLLIELKGRTTEVKFAQFSFDAKKFVTVSDSTARIWDAASGALMAVLKGHSKEINKAAFSPDAKKIVTASDDETAKIWDVATGLLLAELKGHNWRVVSVNFGPDGKKVVTAGDLTAKVWDVESGKLLLDLKGHNDILKFAKFSHDGKKIITTSDDNTAKLWDAETGALLSTFKGHTDKVIFADFSLDDKKMLTTSDDYTARLWNASNGKLKATLKGHLFIVYSAYFSPDGKKIVTTGDTTAKIWDAETGKLLLNIGYPNGLLTSAVFSPDGKKIISGSFDGEVQVWDAINGKRLQTIAFGASTFILDFDTKALKDIDFINNRLLVAFKSEIKIVDLVTGKPMVRFFAIDNHDYIVTDSAGHFDGTEAARKMLYYVCGDEIINLDQIKDLCWEPGLAEKITGTNKEPIKAKRLDEISICNSTPIIEDLEETKDQKRFKIKRRSGGLGEVAIYINRKEVEKIPLASLTFINDETIVTVDLKKYSNYFEAGKENSIQLRARTADLTINSRGSELMIPSEAKTSTAPNLYAIVAGVSDYKGNELDLKYAAKDASDFSNALQRSSRKLLNIDGSEHVFVSTLVSGSSTPPTKANISSAFENLKTNAKPNDIVVIYVSGHGEKYGTETTNFYYLTADASSFNLAGVEKEVAISTNEFAEWLKVIPARKQILILDACASGKLAEDMAIAMRAAVPSDQIKALDRLNSRTGTFILSGAAANQSAYETSMFGQGLLTYSILYGMKSGEALKDNSFVDVDKLFQYCADKVKSLAQGIGGIQDPVISKPYGGASFDIGKMDSFVSSNIILALPKPIFTNSRFTNPETDDDNIGLEKTIDNLLNDYSSRGTDSKVVFAEKSQLAESYKLVGSYHISNNKISVTVRVKKGTTEIQKFEIKDFTIDKDKIAIEILARVEMKVK